MSLASFFFFAAGLSLLLGGALVMARGAARLAEALGLSATARSLVPVAFAASLPELAIAWRTTEESVDLPDFACSVVVGSVIANYLLALAAAALALPLVIPPRLLKFAFPLAIVLSFAMLGAAWTGSIAPALGGCLILSAVAWPIVAIGLERLATAPEKKPRKRRPTRSHPVPDATFSPGASARRLALDVVWSLAGMVAVFFGVRLFLGTNWELAKLSGLDETTYGLTVVAFVATLPEFVLCLLATFRGDRESACGIAVGSSLFNLTAALGVAALRSEDGLVVPPVVFELALPVAIAAGLACVPAFYAMRRFGRASGLGLFAFYVGFVAFAIVADRAYPTESEEAMQEIRLSAMFLFTIGLIVALSLVAIVERLMQKAKLADE